MKMKLLSALLSMILTISSVFTVGMAQTSAFELVDTESSERLGGTIYRYKHIKTGAEVIYNENGSDKREFALGFKTPPTDSKGANHVLEHALFCGSEKYPIKNIMHYIQNGTSSLILNGVTADDCTYYLINSANETEYYNMIDVYMNGIFHPLFLTDENIFRQQGIRIEYVDGKAQYNGVVYNELRIKNLNTEENSVNFLADKLYRALYGDTTPVYSAGGELNAIKELTYEDLRRVYSTFYIPANSMTYLSGNQKIDKTLAVLDSFFSENMAKAPDISLEDTKQIPTEKIQEYNVDESTKTVDIGFMSSGVPSAADAKERYARDLIFDIIGQKMENETGCTKMYTSGGNTGGISNLAMILSEIPIEEQEAIISAYRKVLDDLTQNGIDDQEIDAYIDKQQSYFYANWENIFTGLMYHSDPLAYTEMKSVLNELKNHKEYFMQVLQTYFTENEYSVIIVSGNGAFGAEDSSVRVSAEELEKIKLETEAFQKWNDAEDDPAVIDKIPFLTLDEVKNAPEKSDPRYEEHNGISFYHTEKDGDSASLYFPLVIKDEDFDYTQLMIYFLQNQAAKAGLDFYTLLSPLENAQNPQEINPHILIGFSGDDTASRLRNITDFLKSDDTWNLSALVEYISITPQKILDSYHDPYFLSSELKNSALSAGGRFGSLSPLNSIVKGSPHYYDFLQGLNPDDISEIMHKIKTLAQSLLTDNRPVVGYTGETDGYTEFKQTVTEIFSEGIDHHSADLRLPIGCYSAATITKLADANHFMMAATYDDTAFSGKMTVLGKVLSTKYITPTMRGKHGAYGCSISFRDDEMVSAVAGLADIDLALEIWQGMGDYLRDLKMTQHELDAYIVSAVQEYDEWDYSASEFGAEFALRGKSADICEKIRNEMLSTTVEDLKEYADFVDNLVSQNRLFAVLGKSAADNAKFDFAYYANAETLEVTPRLKKSPDAYIQGITKDAFAPDDHITRAEVAALIDRIISDQRTAQNPSPFYDVGQENWFYNAVVSLSEKGIINGYENGSYEPDNHITRAELAVLLSRFIFNEDAGDSTGYADIDQTDWFYTPMCKMLSNGYLTGYDDHTLRPNQPITRAETVTIINRMLHATHPTAQDNPFTDIDSTHWAYQEILTAVCPGF